MTIKEMLARSVQSRGDAVALRYKAQERWHTVSYRELLVRVHHVTEMLARMGIKPHDRVGLFRENSLEWPEIYFGIVGMGATAVPVDAKLQEQEVSHILRDSGARLLFAGAKSYPLLRDVEPHVPELEKVILVDGREVLPTSSKRLKYFDYEALKQDVSKAANSAGRAYDKHQPAEDDVASFIYTSGTTGRQKGAMLTHRNFTSNVEQATKAIDVKASDNFLLVLPMHHAFAFTVNLLLPIFVGGEISFVENLKTVGENTREVSPTVLIGVPLLLEKMFNRIMTGLKENKVGYTLFRLGVRKPIAKAIAAKLGGKLRLMVTGGAPCDPDLLTGFNKFGVEILEGYGLTETAPVLTFNPQHAPKPGSVGKPVPGVEIKILDAGPEGIGEIAARGPNVMKGYFNNPEAPEAVFRDGWFVTGDLGFIDADGYVTITGRKKSLIVNREGKNIYPEEVEHHVCRSPYIREALALGYREEGEKVGEHVGVIVVPNQEAIDDLAAHEKRVYSEKEVADLLRRETKRVCADISEYKRPRRVQVRWEEFDKTSTGKVKRYLYALNTQDVQ